MTRLPNPTPHINFMPPEAILFGEDAWLETFRKSPPDLIVTIPRNTSEYGHGAFGTGYGQQLMRWVEASYRPAGVIRRGPKKSPIKILTLKK